jgi:hypothetical protein
VNGKVFFLPELVPAASTPLANLRKESSVGAPLPAARRRRGTAHRRPATPLRDRLSAAQRLKTLIRHP